MATDLFLLRGKGKNVDKKNFCFDLGNVIHRKNIKSWQSLKVKGYFVLFCGLYIFCPVKIILLLCGFIGCVLLISLSCIRKILVLNTEIYLRKHTTYLKFCVL